jgi:hypothetical protein
MPHNMGHKTISDDVSTLAETWKVTINIIDEVDEGGRAVSWSEGHNRISPFDGIRALKHKLLLRREGNC